VLACGVRSHADQPGHGAAQASVCPSLQWTTLPAPQLVISHASTFDSQSTVQCDPAAQSVWQGGETHLNSQWLPAPHEHVPSAHDPLQNGLLPSHIVWQGPVPHPKSHEAPRSQVQLPSEHVPVHVPPGMHSSAHGGDEHVK
jgi:hypothetical protein